MPLNFIESRVYVLGNKCKVVLIVLVEVSKCYYYIEQGVVLDFLATTFALVFFGFQDVVIVSFLINTNGSIYPD